MYLTLGVNDAGSGHEDAASTTLHRGPLALCKEAGSHGDPRCTRLLYPVSHTARGWEVTAVLSHVNIDI